MGALEHGRRPASASARLAASRELQALFTERLRSDRLHFITLRAALAHAAESSAAIFDDLSFRAHRLRGVAATFGFGELATAAGRLESASRAAAGFRAAHGDVDVRETLVALVAMLGAVADGAASTAGATSSRTTA